MNWFYNFKIRTKLLMSFILVALIAGLIGYEGITSLQDANDSDTILYQTNTVPLSAMVDLTSAFQRMRANGLELLIENNQQEYAATLKLIKERQADIDTNKAIIRRTVNKAVFEKLDKFVKADDAFDVLYSKFVELCLAEKDNEAIALWRTDMDVARKAEQDALSDLGNIITQRAKNRSDSNTIAANAASRNMLIYVILGMIVAIGLGFFVAKIISNPVKVLLNATIKFASGETDIQLTNASNDEIGELTTAFNRMIEKIALQIQYIDKIPAPVMIIDKEFNVQYINKIGADVVAKDQKQLIGQKCYSLFKTGHCNTESCALFRAMKNDSIYTEETIAHPNGADLPILYTGAPIKNREGQIIGGLEAVTNITEIKDAQNYLTRSTQNLLKAMDKFADGDLTVEVIAEKDNDDIGKLFNGFNESVKNINEIVKNVSEAVQATASASNQISSSSEEMAAGAQEQSSQTSEVASAVEQMTKTILETSKNSNVAADNARRAGEIAIEGGKAVQDTILGMNNIANVVLKSAATVQELGKGSEQIGEIVQVIDDIADQTNLLALNAAIEAARAGEQGRGFAVVADEVRKLAERTTKATKEIAGMIRKIQNDTKEAVNSMNEGTKEVEEGKNLAERAGASLQQIIDSSRKNLDVVTQVAAASEEQSSAAEQISRNIEGISSVTQQSAAGTQQIARAAEDLNRLTGNLQELISRFKLNTNDSGQNYRLAGTRNQWQLEQTVN